MMNSIGANDSEPVSADHGAGIFRAVLVGQGATLSDAFSTFERSGGMCRHPTRHLLGARISLHPEEGDGYYDLTRIGDDVYVLALNFTYKDPRVELVPGDGLIQFYFK